MNYFFSYLITDDELLLEGAEAKHCAKVLRKKLGDELRVLDGKGSEYRCILKEIRRNACVLDIMNKTKHPRLENSTLTIAISPLKNQKRFEWFLEKSTELGVDHIIPLHCQRTEKPTIKKDRWLQILISAMKQSGRYYLPTLHEFIPFDALVQSIDRFDQAYIAYCGKTLPLLNSYLANHKGSAIVLIGPEGDFTPEEFDYAIKHGIKGVSIGPNRYRTETAGILVVSTFHIHN